MELDFTLLVNELNAYFILSIKATLAASGVDLSGTLGDSMQNYWMVHHIADHHYQIIGV
jgi:hypothetical protein